ncbi:MAG TPA: lysine--tRNA ligase [Chloroflexi bacterium]|nr:lysine--tRNA ligase [Chloroflexota bacterium]HCU99497.1 lysine--tRNA ligase [Chloroflexota bacterium]|tara:strand:+ start:1487 stop:3019 length:1533 start_codon:yes stop_codon:yes gene_type:complete
MVINMRSFTDIEKNRLTKLDRLRERGEDPFPNEVNRTHNIDQAISLLVESQSGFENESDDNIQVVLCGRLKSVRTMGKLAFAHIEDVTGRIQLLLRASEIGKERLKQFATDFDLGDFVEATGYIMETRTGEVTLNVSSFRIISKSISPLPASKEVQDDGESIVYSAFDNVESRYRERYADLAVNPHVREIFKTRSKIVTSLREFLDRRDFLEVETPVLQPIYGGAAARPFSTHHNQLHQDLFLRISFELYLKRLLVGGFEKVYEIGRDFRNEGVSVTHNPEFTQLEFYWAYANYIDVMDLTEQMLSFVAEQVCGSVIVNYQGNKLDFSPPWKRISMSDALIEYADIDCFNSTVGQLLDYCEQADIRKNNDITKGKLIETLFSKHVEPNLIQPTFIYDYPKDISPLAKAKHDNSEIVERFEGFIGGMELCNAFTELNNPVDQENRFIEMGKNYSKDSDDAHPLDLDYLRAMDYGMPPNGGFGMGVDRLVMLLTNQSSIREVILFPHLRSKE